MSKSLKSYIVMLIIHYMLYTPHYYILLWHSKKSHYKHYNITTLIIN